MRLLRDAAAVCPLDNAVDDFDADAFEHTAQARAAAACGAGTGLSGYLMLRA